MSENIEIELDSAFQKKLIRNIIAVGSKNDAHPVQFVIAIIQAAKIITDQENLELNDFLKLLGNETDPRLH